MHTETTLLTEKSTSIPNDKILKNPLSVGVSFPILINRDSNHLGMGTAFFYRSKNNRMFLITAGHNFSGTNLETGENRGIPNKIIVIACTVNNHNLAIIGRENFEIKILDEDENPLWLQHPTHGMEVDVVAISCDSEVENIFIQPINEFKFNEQLPLNVCMDVFVLGYPHGYSTASYVTPLYKRGTIASEYVINIDKLPMFYIDTAGAKGMSGAPVIAKSTGHSVLRYLQTSIPTDVFYDQAFVGIYTGRRTDQVTPDIKSDIFNAQLGKVWKKTVIDEIINQDM